MLRIFTEKNNKENKDFFNEKELELLKKINIEENIKLSETNKIISDYICEKYKILGLFQLDDIHISNEDRQMLELKNKIDNSLDRLT